MSTTNFLARDSNFTYVKLDFDKKLNLKPLNELKLVKTKC